MTTYKDYLLTIFQAVSDLSGTSAFSTTDFRFDSNFHNVYSLDCDSSLKLLFKNNWGIDRTTSNGYVTFSYVNNYLQAKARYKYDASGSNQHVTDSTFTGTNYYVKYNSIRMRDERTKNVFCTLYSQIIYFVHKNKNMYKLVKKLEFVLQNNSKYIKEKF
jgi:hypothetical protein